MASRSRCFRLHSVVVFICATMLSGGCVGWRGGVPPAARPDADIRNVSAQTAPAPVITPPPPPASDGSPTTEEAPLRRLARIAGEREKTLNHYLVRIRRRETVNGKDQPLEYILFKYRRAPQSIHIKWLGDESKGREIVYVKGQYEDRIQLLTGAGDLLGPGRRMTFAADSPLVKAKFRYAITEAGIGQAALRFVNMVDGIERGQASAGTAKFLGEQTRPEFPRPLEVVEHVIPPGQESSLMKGGVRFYYFDTTLGLPTLIITFDHNRQQVEYYCFDRIQNPVPLDDADFDPAILWPKKKD